jgi:hypothetical protein
LVTYLGKNFPEGASLVQNEAIQIARLVNPKTQVMFGLRIFPEGGRKKRGGNITFYEGAGAWNIDINGNPAVRKALKTKIAGWTQV